MSVEVWRTTAVAVPSSFLSQLGFYAVLPLLPALLPDVWGVRSPWVVGTALLVLSVSMRGSSILISNLLQRVPSRLAVAGSLGAASAAFLVLSAARGPAPVLLLLAIAGAGISVSALSLRVLVTDSLARADLRSTVFAAVQVAANVAAAAGPLVGAYLVDLSPRLLLGSVAASFGAAAGTALVLVPADAAPSPAAGRPPFTTRLFVDIVRVPRLRSAAVTAAVGCFLYAQLFSAVVLQLTSLTDSGPLRSTVFVANAVLVIVLQVPVTRAINRRLRRSTPPFAFLRGGVMVFALSALVLAAAGGSLSGVLIGVAVFSVAETLFTPMLNTVFADIRGEGSTLEMFNARQLASAVGESSGAFVGGSVFALALAHDAGPAYWVALALLGSIVAAAFRVRPDRTLTGGARSQPRAPHQEKESAGE
ncbi:MFS transporter [Cellulomonas triticagri]|uniref:MFS transporter n=1 Tax=Cellulomonas triticagri TaxID=2483352 RepID=UPI0018F5C7CD|nr:MFS transporter [Cellulomonas triticagri]